MSRTWLAAAALSCCLVAGPALSSPTSGTAPQPQGAGSAVRTAAILTGVREAWFARQWEGYKARFLRDGRIVDNANRDVSHSEGQGYGLLLASLARDPDAFAAIWTWTDRHLMVRPDGLAAWKWEPGSNAVADPNDASDGDILIAWGLAEGARRFNRPDYRTAAERLARAIGHGLLVDTAGGPALLPGIAGFEAPAQPDGPVVNLSYYVFPAFPDLKALAPDYAWDDVRDTGLKLLDASRFGPLRLPADWEGLGRGHPWPAHNFPGQFGYNAIRIPLYLAWAGLGGSAPAARFAGLWNPDLRIGPFVTDARDGAAREAFDGAGFRLVAALAACTTSGRSIPPDLVGRPDPLYYPETLRLLAIAVLQERYPQCL